MKKKILIITALILLLTFETFYYSYAADNNSLDNSLIEYDDSYIPEIDTNFTYSEENQKILDDLPVIGCKAAYVAEPTTGKVLYEKNAHVAMYPASTTKILTALVVLENCELTDIAIVSHKAIDLVPSGYSNAKLQAGERLTIVDLLYALLVPSANEAANVLAEHVSGSVEEFAKLCNKRAKELGCENLHFVNPNGIHDENHYCTAYDLYLIAKECQKYEIFNEIVKTKSFTLPATNVYKKEDRTFTNTNYLLLKNMTNYYYPYCTGIKTGHTTPAGECLVASSSHDNLNLISVVLGGGTNKQGLNERFYDTKQLFEYLYNNYSVRKIAEEYSTITTVKVEKATKETKNLDIVVDKSITTIVPNEIDKDNIKTDTIIDNQIVAPVAKNQVIGQITYYADGLEYTTNLLASHSVDKMPYQKYNFIVLCVAILTIITFIVLFKIFNKHKKLVLLIDIIILFLEGICLSLLINYLA